MNNELIIEDKEVSVIAPKRAFAPGHLVVIPKSNEIILEQVNDESIKKIFQVANKLSSVLFDALGCEGTNILIQNGIPAGQINEVFSVSIIPRKDGDELKLDWEPKQASQEELEASMKRFKAFVEEEAQKKMIEEKKKVIEQKKEEVIKPDSENYLIKSIIRQP